MQLPEQYRAANEARGLRRRHSWIVSAGLSALTSVALYLGVSLSIGQGPWDSRVYRVGLWVILGSLACVWPRHSWITGPVFVVVQSATAIMWVRLTNPAGAGWWPLEIFPLTLLVVLFAFGGILSGLAIAWLAKLRRGPRTQEH